MKNLIYLTTMLITISSCSSQKKLQENAPFKVSTPTSQKWVGGKEKSGSGTEVKIPISQIKDENIAMQQLYFRGKITDVTYEVNNGKRYILAKFLDKEFHQNDIIMHGNIKNEVGNRPPKLEKNENEQFPFVIENNEAILSYIEKDGKKVKYIKITGIKQKQPLIYSSKQMN